jgi:YHS domain-containing protein
MQPPRADPVCGMACEEGFARSTYRGKEYCFCSGGCLRTFEQGPSDYRDQDHVRGTYTLAFTDTKTGRSVLDVPITFTGKGGTGNGEHIH